LPDVLRRGGLLLALLLSVSAGYPAAPAAAEGNLAAPAAADGGLAGSSPAAGSALGPAPARVVLTFAGVPDVALSHISVLADGGAAVNAGDARRGPARTLSQPVSIDEPGNFTVAYHVEFEGGGESTGSLRFSVGTGAAPPAPDLAARRATANALTAHEHGVDPLSAGLLVINGVVVLAVLGLLYLRRPYPAHPAPRE
jgi:methionine-rich copper-binding protein CopC